MSEESDPKAVKIANPEELNEEKTLLEWTAPERTFQRRDRDFWITAIAILAIVSVIFIFIKEFFLVVALFSVLFLYYTLSTVPPQNIKSKITNKAIYFGEARYPWDILERFWFKKSLGHQQILFETRLKFPRQLNFIIDPVDEEKIKQIVIKRLPMFETSPNTVDRLTRWFADRLPLENREK